MSDELEHKKWLSINWFWKFGIALITVLVSLFGIDAYLDNKINTALQNEKIIKKLQTYVRPYLIFDQNGAILSDQGAWQYIEDIDVLLNDKGFVKKITLTLKTPNTTPILTSLDDTVNYSFKKVRGKKLDIIIELEVRSFSEPRAMTSLFNLEIVSGDTLQVNYETDKKEKVMYFPGKIYAVEGFETFPSPGERKMNISMGEDPIYDPREGDTYYDTRIHSYLVFSQGKWKKLLFADDNDE